MSDVDLQAEAERDWWRDSHDIAEAKRQHLEKVMRKCLNHLDLAVETDDFAHFWGHVQQARKRLRKELP